MELIIGETRHECNVSAAHLIEQTLHTQGSGTCALAMATGNTTAGLFETLVSWCAEERLDFSGAEVFMVDEYRGLGPDDPASIHYRAREQLVSRINLPPENFHVLNGQARDADAECHRYESLIRQAGGLDMAVLGLGQNGHVGFNEPGGPFGAGVHTACIARESREYRAAMFGLVDHVPAQGLTMGIKTLMHAQQVVLMALGAGKASTAERVLIGPVSTDVPASVLQLHPRLTAILDREAAGELEWWDEKTLLIQGLSEKGET